MSTLPYPWLQQSWQHLAQQLQHFPHALLLSGQVGIGKIALSHYLAQTLLCPEAAQSAAPCQHCAGCLLWQAETHPDYLCIQGQGKSETITVDLIRAVSHFAQQTSQRQHAKVVVIEHAEKMNVAAQNALLKTLEEPNPDTYLILVSSQPHRLLPTIRSRTRHYPVKITDHNACHSWLHAALTAEKSEQDSKLWLKVANGAPLLAKALALTGAEMRQQILQDTSAIVLKQRCPVSIVEHWQKFDLAQTLQYLNSFLLDCVKVDQLGDDAPICNQDQQENIRQVAKQKGAKALLRFQTLVLRRCQELQKNANLNKQLALETLMTSWQTGQDGLI